MAHNHQTTALDQMSIPALSALSADRPAHYYTRDGQPMYEVTKADGDGTRPPTVRDARKGNWLPSVTNIMSVWPRAGLDIYQRQQDLLAALTLPRLPGEGLDEFCKRVIEDSEAHRDAAAAFGHHVHRMFEDCLHGQLPVVEGPAAAWYPFVKEFCGNHVSKTLWTEKVLVNNSHHYAARSDAAVLLSFEQYTCGAILDVKTQNVKKGRIQWYDTWAMQLAAYRKAANVELHDFRVANIVFDSNIPGPPRVKVYDEDDLKEAWENFGACYNLWCRVKQYDPALVV